MTAVKTIKNDNCQCFVANHSAMLPTFLKIISLRCQTFLNNYTKENI